MFAHSGELNIVFQIYQIDQNWKKNYPSVSRLLVLLPLQTICYLSIDNILVNILLAW